MALPVIPITDPNDLRLADYVGLSDPDIRRRAIDRDFFIAEGVEVVRRLVKSGLTLRSIVLSPNRVDIMTPILANVACPIYTAERKVISAVVGFDLHRGIVGSAFRPTPMTLEEVLDRPPLGGSRHRIAVLEGLGDHENLGAIARSARAFNIDAMVIDTSCADPYYRRTVRVSMGEILFLPVIRMEVTEVMEVIHRHHGTVIALTPRADAVLVKELKLSSPGPLAFVFGAEGSGLPEETLRAADMRGRIDIASDVDSLNVGHAAAVTFALTDKL